MGGRRRAVSRQSWAGELSSSKDIRSVEHAQWTPLHAFFLLVILLCFLNSHTNPVCPCYQLGPSFSKRANHDASNWPQTFNGFRVFFYLFFFSFVALLPSQAYSQPRLERFILFKLKPQRTFVILGCNEKKVWKSLLGRNVFNVFFDVCRLSRKVSRGLQSSLPDKWHSTRICVSCMRIKHYHMFMVMKLGQLQRGLQKNKQ